MRWQLQQPLSLMTKCGEWWKVDPDQILISKKSPFSRYKPPTSGGYSIDFLANWYLRYGNLYRLLDHHINRWAQLVIYHWTIEVATSWPSCYRALKWQVAHGCTLVALWSALFQAIGKKVQQYTDHVDAIVISLSLLVIGNTNNISEWLFLGIEL